MSQKPARYFCIHGHFYQPPRENPLIGDRPRQTWSKTMTNPNETRPAPAQDLDDASLDLVVGAGIMVPDLRKQEQADKLAGSPDA